MLDIDVDDIDQPRGDEGGRQLTKKTGIEPGVTFNQSKNEGLVTFDAETLIDPDDTDPFMWVLRDQFGEYADMFEVVEGTVSIGMWEGFYKNHISAVKDEDGNWEKTATHGKVQMRRYSAKIRRRVGHLPKLVKADLEEAISTAKALPRARRRKHDVDLAVINLADLQLGKTQRGLGTEDNLKNIYDRMEQATTWLEHAKPKRIALVNPGDLVEACDGFYATQTYDVDLNNREQLNAARTVVADHLDAFAPLAPELVFATAPSNHGEFRIANGKTATDPARDNRDLVVADMIETLAPHKWKHLEVATPHLTDGDPYLASFLTSSDESAKRIGVIHGHQVRAAGGAPIIKLANWWSQNFMSDINRPRQAEGIWPEDCHVMLAGHFHHWNTYTGKSRLLMTMPASDLGSEWYTTGSGFDNPAGLLCFTFDEDHPHGIDELRIFAAA